MKKLLLGLAAFAALLLSATPAQAQTPASAAYTGPRFPGGPDSLRALVYRSTRLEQATAIENTVVEVELKDGRQPSDFSLVALPKGYKLTPPIAMAIHYLYAKMPNWEPSIFAPHGQPSGTPRIRLFLDFTTPLNAQPYAYADQNPASPDPTTLGKAQRKNHTPFTLNYSQRGLTEFIQTRVLYPPAAFRQRLQGVVYAYFEVAENGAIERLAIVGSIGEALDTEVLKALKQLPNATMPALLHGKPVRVYYVLPITFRIM